MQNLPQYFGASYLINLPERTDRLARARTEFGRAGWDVGPAGVELFPACKFEVRARFPNTGVRGAFHSHWECLQRAEARRGNVLILEDDIALSPVLANATPTIVGWLDTNEWDLVYFGHYQTGAIPNATLTTKPEDICFEPWGADIHGLHFYGANERVLSRLNAHLAKIADGIEGDQENGPMPVDGAINNFRRKNPDVRTFIGRPKLGWQSPSRSDITPGKLDRLHVLRPLTTVLRNMKHLAASWRL
jgi:hypothetical protein